MGWWDDNGPRSTDPNADTTPPSGGGSLADQVAAFYQQYLGRAPESDAVVQNWITGTGGNLDAIRNGIAGSPEAATYLQKLQSAPPQPTATNTNAPGGPVGGDPTSYLQSLLAQGMDPNAAVNQTNSQYNLPSGSSFAYYAPGAHGAGSGAVIGVPGGGYLAQGPGGGSWNFNQGDKGGGGGGSGPAYTPVSTYQPTVAPYTPMATPAPLSLPQMALPAPVTLPTAAEAQATPGYQFTRDQGLLAINRAAAPGGIGGAVMQKAADYATGLADTTYQNTVANRLGLATANVNLPLAVQQANAGNLLNAYTASNNAALGAGYYNLAGQGQQFGQGLSLANLGLSQAQLGLYAQNQFWGQGLAENQNAFSQYNTNQNAAFNQWLELAKLGYVGNPYA
jgi:hypothetical protein